ncbi:hypothetical protein ACIA5D_51500 [Actinoplanes sp. NPDC051513]|uniref:nSTAND1 domain-containing NTPase n=1 Tax=Actinoplanes sp. NPDC051513 TaxID=3363908 RepID=UPI00379F218A
MARRRIEYQGDLVPFLASVFFGFAINILTAQTSGWWGPLQPITRYPWIWVPVCLLAWVGWEVRRRTRSKPSWAGSDSPYPGLEPFSAAHTSVFFGREEETRDLVIMLTGSSSNHQHRFVMLVGPSGSGKSSLIRAGVLPRLPRNWQVYGPLRLGSDPFGGLAAVLCVGGDRAHTARRLRDDARRGGDPAHLLALMHPEIGRALLVVDQWEDLYTLCDEPERALFLQLMAALLRAHPDVYLLAVMRPEHYAAAARETALPAVVSVPLASLKPGELRQAIEEPGRASGVSFDDGLVNTMVIESTAHDSDALPLLGHLLRQLHEDAADDVITTAQYNAAGRVAGAIARHADRVYQSLVNTTPKESVDDVLLRAVGVEGDRTIRRSVPTAGLDEPSRLTLNTFRDARLMVETDRQGSLEFAHEAVLREWPTLRGLIDAHSEQLRRITLLEQRAAAWRGSDESDDLLRGAALQQAEALIRTIRPTSTVLEFLKESRASSQQDHGRRADQAAAWAQQLEPQDHELAIAVASAAVTELAATDAAVLTLWGLRAEPEVARFSVAHTALICSMVWLPDGHLRTLDETGKVCTWSAGHHAEEMRLSEPGLRGRGTLSGCGGYVLGESGRGSLGLWRVVDGGYLGGRNSEYSSLGLVAWRHDQMFAAKDGPNRVDLFALEESQPVHRHTITGNQVEALAFSPSGDYFGVAGPGKVLIYRSDAWSKPAVTVKVRGEVTKLAFSPTGEQITVLLRRQSGRLIEGLTLAVYDFSGRRIAAWPADGLREAFAWAPDGTAIAYMQTDKDDRYVTVRSTTGPQMVRRPREEVLDFLTMADEMAWSADGSIALGGRTGNLAVWSVETGAVDLLPGGALWRISWSADRSCLALTTHRRPVRLVNAERMLCDLPEDSAGARARWSPAGPVLAVGEAGAVKLYASDATLVNAFGHGEGMLGDFAWSPDGTRIALSHYDFFGEQPTVISVWDTTTGKQLSVMADDAGASHIVFCPDGRRLAGPAMGGVSIWDSHSGEVLSRWNVTGGPVSALAWSGDGQRLAAGVGEQLHIWDPASAAGDTRCLGLSGGVEGLCWSPDSALIAGVDGRRLRVWDSRDGKPMLTIRSPDLVAHQDPNSRVMVGLQWDTKLTMTMADGRVLGWSVPVDGQAPSTSPEGVERLTADDRQRYGLPPAGSQAI